MRSVAAHAQPNPGDSAIALSDTQRLRAFTFGGLVLALMNFASPAGGTVDIPVSRAGPGNLDSGISGISA